jgi:rhodanese-related sulfurtransferase
VVDKFERDKLMNTLEGLEKRLADLGIELETVRSRRLQAQTDLRRLSALAEKGDQKARNAQDPVNKAVAADSTLITSLGREIDAVKRTLGLVRAQQASVVRRQHEAETAALPKDKLFEVMCPDGRRVRHRAASLAAQGKSLLPNYTITAEIFGADENGDGGFVAAIGAKSTMAGMLMASGEELLAFLEAHGVPVARA